MSCTDPYTFLKTLIARDEAEAYARTRKTRPPLVVTLSRDYAANGELIAEKLGECLGIPVYDREILDRVARKAGVDTFKLEAQDEGTAGGVSTFLYSLLTGTAGDMQTYRRALYETVLELAQKDGLLVGRGAHLILAGKKVFRVRIVGSKIVCAKRLAEETGLPLPEAERKVYEINTKRHKSIQNLFGDSFEHCSLEFAKNFDLVINTDHIAAEDAVPIILLGMQKAGFDLRTAPAKS
jgi:cytidylate kinase